MKLSEAMEILPVSRQTLRNMIDRGEIVATPKQGGKTTPLRVYEASVTKVAHDWGLL